MLQIDDDFHKKLKILAIEQNLKLKELFKKALENYSKEETK